MNGASMGKWAFWSLLLLGIYLGAIAVAKFGLLLPASISAAGFLIGFAGMAFWGKR